MEFEEKYRRCVLALQAIATRSGKTRKKHWNDEWQEAEAFQDCKRAAEKCLEIIGEPKRLPSYTAKAQKSKNAANAALNPFVKPPLIYSCRHCGRLIGYYDDYGNVDRLADENNCKLCESCINKVKEALNCICQDEAIDINYYHLDELAENMAILIKDYTGIEIGISCKRTDSTIVVDIIVD